MKIHNSLVLVLMLSSFSALSKVYMASEDLYERHERDTRKKTATKIIEDSKKDYEKFIKMDVNNEKNNANFRNDFGKPQSISKNQARTVLEAANYNPVVSLHSYNKYDPKNDGIGFCFGRAMFVNLFLAMNKVDRGSIKKAFVVGTMTDGGGGEWGWHVTTIVQSKDSRGAEKWLTIDPITDDVMDVWDWYMKMRESSVDKKLRLYITDAGKFGVYGSRYDEQDIKDRFYNKYFTDMMKWFQNNDVTGELGLVRVQ